MKNITHFLTVIFLVSISQLSLAETRIVKIKTIPGNAKIYINGKREAFSPYKIINQSNTNSPEDFITIELDTGKYTIEAIKAISGIYGEQEWYGVAPEVVVMVDKNTAPITLTLKKRQTSIFQKRAIKKQAISEQLILKNTPHIIEPSMVSIPAGSYDMGYRNMEYSDGAHGKSKHEPIHNVSIKPFLLSKYEITVEQWYSCIALGGCRELLATGLKKDYKKNKIYLSVDRLKSYHYWLNKNMGNSNKPMVNISWDDTQQYIAWLNKKTNKHYRLPSEAEWEYAARAGISSASTGYQYAFRNCDDCGNKSWVENYIFETLPVGWFSANYFGLHDLNGNVREWTQDCWQEDYFNAPKDGSAVLLKNCTKRVARGSSEHREDSYISSIKRSGYSHAIQLRSLGFRLAHDKF